MDELPNGRVITSNHMRNKAAAMAWHLECVITGQMWYLYYIYYMVAGYVWIYYSCITYIGCSLFTHFLQASTFIFHQIETEVLKWSKYTKGKILIRIFKANLPNVRVRVSCFHTITFQTKRNKWIVPGISSMASGKPRWCLQSNQASFHEETATSKTIHASTLHVTRLSHSVEW